MFKIDVQIQAEGNKDEIYRLKEELLRIASQHNCLVRAEMTNNSGFQESLSASFNPIIEIPLEDIIDMAKTGEEQYEQLLLEESRDESSK